MGLVKVQVNLDTFKDDNQKISYGRLLTQGITKSFKSTRSYRRIKNRKLNKSLPKSRW